MILTIPSYKLLYFIRHVIKRQPKEDVKKFAQGTMFSLRFLLVPLDFIVVNSEMSEEEQGKTIIHEKQHIEDMKQLGFWRYVNLYRKEIKANTYWGNLFELRAWEAERTGDIQYNIKEHLMS